MKNRKELKLEARSLFNMNHWPCVLAGVLWTLASGVWMSFKVNYTNSQAYYENGYNFSYSSSFSGAEAIISALILLLTIFVLNVLMVGVVEWFLKLRKGEQDNSMFLKYFSQKYYWKTVEVMFVSDLKIALWTLLLIIPGIIKSLEYFYVPEIYVENPELSTDAILDRCSNLTMNHKGDIFILGLSFIPWEILSVITFGIAGVLFVNPYAIITHRLYYNELKENQLHISE